MCHNPIVLLETGLAGRVALVTGAASGIGQAISVALAGEGARLILADRNPCDETAEQIASSNGESTSLMVDLSDRTQVIAMVAAAHETHGAIDLFVNNAAVAAHSALLDLQPEAWTTIMDTNLAACVWACREIGRIMVRAGSGSILIIGSTSVYTPRATEASYRVSKTGLKALMEVLAIELAPAGVRVNMLTPGSFHTGLTKGMSDTHRVVLDHEIPLARTAMPYELAATAVLLLSDRLSPYTTGADFLVDGGLHLRPIQLG